MRGLHLLHLDAHGVRAYRWRREGLTLDQAFPVAASNADGMAAFDAYLERHAGSTFRLLANLAEESHRLDDIPPLRGKDRRMLIERHLSQHFPGTTLTNATSLGHRPSGRGDEVILFSAFTRPADFAPWLNAMRQQQIRLAGIHSTALLSRALAPTLLPRHGAALLLTLGRDDLRQNIYVDGEFRFSRLTVLSTPALSPGSRVEAATACAREASRIRQHLVAQEMLEWNGPLTTTILLPSDRCDAFDAHCQDTDELRFSIADLSQTATIAGFNGTAGDIDSTTLFMHLLARRGPHAQFAPPQERRMFQLHRIKRALQFGQALVATGAIGFAVAQALEIGSLRERAEASRRQAQAASQEHQALLTSLPAMPALPTAPNQPVDSEALRILIDRHDALASRTPFPRPLLVALSHMLDRLPQIAPQRLDWRLSDTLEPGTDEPAVTTRPSFALMRVEAGLKPSPAADAHDQPRLREALEGLAHQAGDISLRILSPPASAQPATSGRGSVIATPTAPTPIAFILGQKLP